MKTQIVRSAVAAAIAGALALPVLAQNLAIINGKPLPMQRYESFKQQVERTGRQITPEMEEHVKEQFITAEIFTQEAARQGLEANPNYRAQMELARQQILINELFERYQASHPVTDAEIKAEYDKFAQAAGGKEYKASHILVETEDEAKAIIASLAKGGNFGEIAKKQSKDPGSGARGGDLDWANPASYVPEFSEAMVKLAKGQTTLEPVKSQFGYHIIRIDDVRETELPSLDDVKPQISQQLMQRKIQTYQDELRAKAKVQ